MTDTARSTELRKHAEWAEDTLYRILHGEKPAIDLNDPAQAWLYHQMQIMHENGFLADQAKSFIFLRPNEDPLDKNLQKLKGVTLREPLSKALTSKARDLRRSLEKHDIHCAKTLGEDYSFRYKRDPLEQIDLAHSFILPEAGLAGLYQWVRFFNAAERGDINLHDKAVILQNKNGFWAPFIRHFQESPPFYISKSTHESAQIIKSVIPRDKRQEKAQYAETPYTISSGDTILSVTGNMKKVVDYRKVMNERQNGISIQSWHKIFPSPREAEETSYSYLGNNLEKLETLHALIEEKGIEQFYALCKTHDIDPEKTFLLFDDQGFETEANLTDSLHFSKCMAERRNTYKSFGPGPETKGLVSSCSDHRDFMMRIKQEHDDRVQDVQDAGVYNPDDKHLSIKAQNHGCAIIIRLSDILDAVADHKTFQQLVEEDNYFIFHANTEDSLNFEQAPPNGPVDSKNYLVPLQDPKGRTQADIPDYTAKHSLAAQTVKAFARVLGFDDLVDNGMTLSQKFHAAHGRDIKIATQHTLHKGKQAKIDGLINYTVFDGNGGAYALDNFRKHRVKNSNGKRFSYTSPLNNFQDMCKQVDGFIFAPDTDDISGKEYFWEKLFYLTSVICGHQITDKTIADKPTLFIAGSTWDKYRQMIEAFCGGLIPEMPDHLYSVLDPDQSMEDQLSNAFTNYVPNQFENNLYRESGPKPDHGLFNVTVYCSASTTNTQLKERASDFTSDLAGMGFAVTNGGGAGPDGLMFETSAGVHNFRNNIAPYLEFIGKAVPDNFIASIQCTETTDKEGLLEYNDYWCSWPNIFMRMQDLQNCEAELVLPGGAGTIQEISASIIMRKSGFTPILYRPLIIVNEDGIYDPLIKLIPKEDFARYNLHIVEHESQAMDILLKSRHAMGMAPKLDYTYQELKKLKQRATSFRKTNRTPPNPSV